MTAHLTILGSGSIVPTKERNSAAFLLEVGGQQILLDCGPGTIRRLMDFGIDMQSIDAMFVSHFHTDHFGDAAHLVHTRFVDDLYRKAAHKSLTIFGPKNIKKHFKTLRKIFWPEPNEKYPLKIYEGPRKIKKHGVAIELFDVKHVPWFKSVGIRVKFGKKSVVYTGDIGSKHSFSDLIKQTRNANLLLIEASHMAPHPNHYSFAQIKKLVEKANIKKVLIIHIPVYQIKPLEKLVRKNPKFRLGVDGLKISI